MHDLVRSSVLRHPASGTELQTPLLIPSFSSKGFALQKDGKSEIRDIAVASSEFITDVVLISAYDVYYQHIQPPENLPIRAALTFVDSGGYEISTDRDYSSVMDSFATPEPWSRDKLVAVYDKWPADLPAVFVNYDHHEERCSLEEQIADANDLFNNYPKQLHLFLIKPSPGREKLYKDLESICDDPSQLGGFDVIGVTEKELGSSLLDRMTRIAQLRTAFNEAGIKVPLHIFGALDPISIRLYFLAGAEIFDGLTWLRYGYRESCCLYLHDLGALEYGIHVKQNLIKTRAISGNYYALEELRHQLIAFYSSRKPDKFAPHVDLVTDAWDQLQAQLNRRA